ncbi:hypothetical protein ColLi_12833 [Colletotrichum liriopes]|uniref:Uncharacterized protein n=1 Tax=Colletotrichum liriopes TaxID=708192 RepID=A0AA37LY72_9PEZI|nr:hypothetical protein ColLi_12833 [Colletotrichum liriopes]
MFLKDAEQQILIARINQDRDDAEDLNRKNSVYPVFSTFKPTNSKRVVASATCLIGGGVGGITPSTASMLEESPNYTVSHIRCSSRKGVVLIMSFRTGIWTTFAISMVSIFMIIITDIYL